MNSILSWMGSEWSDFSMGCLDLVLVTSLVTCRELRKADLPLSFEIINANILLILVKAGEEVALV